MANYEASRKEPMHPMVKFAVFLIATPITLLMLTLWNWGLGGPDMSVQFVWTLIITCVLTIISGGITLAYCEEKKYFR